jgi:hypothetical protein
MIRGLVSHVFIRLPPLVRSAAFAGLVGFASVALTAQAPPRQAGAADSFNGGWRLDEKASTGVPPMMRGHETAVHLTQSNNQLPGGTEHLLWELEPGGQTIRRTSTNPETKAPPQVYVYRRMQSPGGAGARVPPRQ